MSTASIAQLSLELNVSQKHIKAVLHDIVSELPDSRSETSGLSATLADAVRTRLAASGSESKQWTLEIGDTVRRRDLHAAYGGQAQSGIVTPRSLRDILVFTSPESGSKHGYDAFEGLQEDGSFLYTGEGQRGPQQFTRGNAALRDAAHDGRPIRVFTKQGVFVTYVGEFTTGEPAFALETIPDAAMNPRQGIIFRLIPVSADAEALSPRNRASYKDAYLAAWTPPEVSPFVTQGNQLLGERVVTRIEFALQADFGQWIRERRETPRRILLSSAGTTLEPDFYVEESGWIVEAKRSPARNYVRTAIGQVLDYARLAREAGYRAVPVILLPSRPIPHLEALLVELGIVLVVRSDHGFTVLE